MIFSVLPGMSTKDIPKEAAKLHFVRPVKKELLEEILKNCPGFEAASARKSCIARMPAKSVSLLKEKSVVLETESRAGRPISMPL